MLTQQLIVIIILIATIMLFIFDILRVDLVAILCMLSLGWSGILEPLEAISGFSSNAVIAMIAVMVIGSGIYKTGIMEKFSRWIIKIVSGNKRKLIVLVSLSVGLISAFIQNIGAAALFLPVIIIIAKKENYHPSELIMPMGFAAILGGTLTMVASGPLIILNDFLRSAGLEPYNLFSVTPVGLLLLLTGILYFYFLGPYVLPKRDVKSVKPEQEMLIESWQLPNQVRHYYITEKSPLVGKTPEAAGIWEKYQLNILALSMEKDIEYAPWRETHFKPGQKLALLGNEERVKEFAVFYNLQLIEKSDIFPDFQNPQKAGFAESIIPPRSEFVGKTIRQLAIRKNYHIEPIMIFSQGKAVRGNFSDRTLVAGDILIFHGLWKNINHLKETSQIIVLTSIKTESEKKGKSFLAIACFAAGIGLALAGYPLSIALLTSAVVMVLTGVLNIEEFYQAIDWKVVFLIAGLIPLGIAMEKTGTAAFLAEKLMFIMQGKHPVLIIFSIALISTLFSLFMSNVASTVVLVPLIINLSVLINMDARPLVLLVAVCAANSFILPTHQVNAMLITAGSYENSDYLKAGGIMTFLFLVVVTFVFYFFYF
ncbi:MAG: SLC13 family permease [Atribacterota bacterium]|nr:SLC13 family permease [Atribacterota bacterium]